jgi:hypothetical protein
MAAWKIHRSVMVLFPSHAWHAWPCICAFYVLGGVHTLYLQVLPFSAFFPSSYISNSSAVHVRLLFLLCHNKQGWKQHRPQVNSLAILLRKRDQWQIQKPHVLCVILFSVSHLKAMYNLFSK